MLLYSSLRGSFRARFRHHSLFPLCYSSTRSQLASCSAGRYSEPATGTNAPLCSFSTAATSLVETLPTSDQLFIFGTEIDGIKDATFLDGIEKSKALTMVSSLLHGPTFDGSLASITACLASLEKVSKSYDAVKLLDQLLVYIESLKERPLSLIYDCLCIFVRNCPTKSIFTLLARLDALRTRNSHDGHPRAKYELDLLGNETNSRHVPQQKQPTLEPISSNASESHNFGTEADSALLLRLIGELETAPEFQIDPRLLLRIFNRLYLYDGARLASFGSLATLFQLWLPELVARSTPHALLVALANYSLHYEAHTAPSGQAGPCLQLLEQYQSQGLVNDHSLAIAIKACLRAQDLESAKQLQSQMRHPDDMTIGSMLLRHYLYHGAAEEALRLYTRLRSALESERSASALASADASYAEGRLVLDSSVLFYLHRLPSHRAHELLPPFLAQVLEPGSGLPFHARLFKLPLFLYFSFSQPDLVQYMQRLPTSLLLEDSNFLSTVIRYYCVGKPSANRDVLYEEFLRHFQVPFIFEKYASTANVASPSISTSPSPHKQRSSSNTNALEWSGSKKELSYLLASVDQKLATLVRLSELLGQTLSYSVYFRIFQLLAYQYHRHDLIIRLYTLSPELPPYLAFHKTLALLFEICLKENEWKSLLRLLRFSTQKHVKYAGSLADGPTFLYQKKADMELILKNRLILSNKTEIVKIPTYLLRYYPDRFMALEKALRGLTHWVRTSPTCWLKGWRTCHDLRMAYYAGEWSRLRSAPKAGASPSHESDDYWHSLTQDEVQGLLDILLIPKELLYIVDAYCSLRSFSIQKKETLLIEEP